MQEPDAVAAELGPPQPLSLLFRRPREVLGMERAGPTVTDADV